LNFVGPINKKIQGSIDFLISIHDLQSKTKIIIEERLSQWFQEINPATKPLPSPPEEFLSRSKPKIQKQIIVKNQVRRQSNKTILFIEILPEITKDNEIYISPHADRQFNIQLHDFLTENDQHVNVMVKKRLPNKFRLLMNIISKNYIYIYIYICL